jgi:hypothetical protein
MRQTGGQVLDELTDFTSAEEEPDDWPFEDKATHAKWLGKAERTIDNWRDLPDGLPFTMLGRVPMFHRGWTIQWLEGRRQQRNPTKLSPRQPPRAGAKSAPNDADARG